MRKIPATAWKKGQTGNPNGRPPKGHSITETIKAMMDEKPEIKKALGAKILEMAMRGDITAMKMLWNYMDGMPIQKQEIGGADGEPIRFNIIAGASYFSTVGQTIAASDTDDNDRPAEVQSASVAQESKEDDNGDKSDSSVEST